MFCAKNGALASATTTSSRGVSKRAVRGLEIKFTKIMHYMITLRQEPVFESIFHEEPHAFPQDLLKMYRFGPSFPSHVAMKMMHNVYAFLDSQFLFFCVDRICNNDKSQFAPILKIV
jgi:hypothetical protein